MYLTGIHLRAPLQLVTPWTQTRSLILTLTHILNSAFRKAHLSTHTGLSGPTTPLGSNPNPKQGIQASACRGLLPKPIDWGHLSHNRRLCLPPRRKCDTWNSKDSEQEKSAYAHLRPPLYLEDVWTSSRCHDTLTHALNSAPWGAKLRASRLGQLCP